jgi:hypothetical protein
MNEKDPVTRTGELGGPQAIWSQPCHWSFNKVLPHITASVCAHCAPGTGVRPFPGTMLKNFKGERLQLSEVESLVSDHTADLVGPV